MTERLWENTCNQILRITPLKIKNILRQALLKCSDIREIVLRADMPVCIYTFNDLMYLTANGCMTSKINSQSLVYSSAYDVTECFNMACGYSVYSHMSEIKEGFVTISGGHRVGICGTAVVNSGEITNIRDVSTVSIRVCREVIGCSKELVSLINKSTDGLMICGIPCSGKTTVLRDLARILSLEEKRRVSLIDTRGELASSYKGVAQMDVGLCDVLSGYPRYQGIIQALKVFSPEFIMCDELGSDADCEAVISGVNSGVRFVTTTHASCFEEFKMKPYIKKILSTGAFENVVFLQGRDNPGKVENTVAVRKCYDG